MNSWNIKAHDLLHHQATQLADILRDVDLDDPILSQRNDRLIGHRSAAGDEQRLRMIPVYARGVPGCIPGTSPHGFRNNR